MAYMPYNRIILIQTERNGMNGFNVEFFTNDDGSKPAKEFLISLDNKMRAKIMGEISLLEEYGNQMREPYTKSLGDGIFELRTKVGSDISRVLYFFYYGKRIILTNGFIKKTRKTPKSEIELAKKYRNRFIERDGKNE